jgi:dephospho-CoA kinase
MAMSSERALQPSNDGFAPVLGLTGGIAVGKSTVGRMLSELGADLIDADQLSREVVLPGAPALAAIVNRFGADICDDKGRLDRKRLGALVFADSQARADLEAILHPAIANLSQHRFLRARQAGAKLIVYEAALLIETGRHRDMDRVLVVVADEQVRLRRLTERDGFSREQASARIASQMPQQQKRQVADFVVDNSRTIDETRKQVEQVWQTILAAP